MREEETLKSPRLDRVEHDAIEDVLLGDSNNLKDPHPPSSDTTKPVEITSDGTLPPGILVVYVYVYIFVHPYSFQRRGEEANPLFFR